MTVDSELPNLHNACITNLRLAPGGECGVEILSGPYQEAGRRIVIRWELVFSGVNQFVSDVDAKADLMIEAFAELPASAPVARHDEGTGEPTGSDLPGDLRHFRFALEEGTIELWAYAFRYRE